MRKCVCFEISDLNMKEQETYAQVLSLAINAAREQMEQLWTLSLPCTIRGSDKAMSISN